MRNGAKRDLVGVVACVVRCCVGAGGGGCALDGNGFARGSDGCLSEVAWVPRDVGSY